jgi:hypothetical protein
MNKRLISILLIVLLSLSLFPTSNVAIAADGSRPNIYFVVDNESKTSLVTYTGGSGAAALAGAGVNIDNVQATANDFQIRFAAAKNSNYDGLLGFTITVNDKTSERVTISDVEAVGMQGSATDGKAPYIYIDDESTGVYYRMMNNTNTGLQIRLSYVNTVDSPDITVTWCFDPEHENTETLTIGESVNGVCKQWLTNTLNTYTLTATPNDDYAFDYWESRPTSGDEDDYVIDDTATEQGATAIVTLTKDTTYRAVFARAVPKLTGIFQLKKTDAVKMPPFAGYNHAKGFWYTKSYTGTPLPEGRFVKAAATLPARLMVCWDATGTLKTDSETFYNDSLHGRSEINETFGKYVDLELWEGESATGMPFYSCEDIVLTAATQGGQDEYWKIPPKNNLGEKYFFEMYFAMPDADKLTFKLTYKDYDKSVISTETLTMDTPHDPAPDVSDIVPITVTMSVEKLTVNGEYIVEPTQIVVPEGSTVAYTLKELLKAAYPEKGYDAYRGSSNYVAGIWDPSYTSSTSYPGYLNEFDYGGASGWKYCQNNVFPTLGIAQSVVHDGDVVRFQYTRFGLGSDLNNRADKDELLKQVAAIRADGTESSYGVNYINALAVLKTLDAPQSAVEEALDALQPIPIVWVTDITDVPATATVGTPLTLSGTVTPDDATYNTITWSVKAAGTTGAAITDGVLTATAAGTVTVTAAIADGAETGDFTKDFDITVKTATVWVTDITDVPATATVGTPLTLSGTVTPADATYNTITWSVKTAGTTGAAITDGVLTATSAGTVTVTAAIADGAETGDFTKDFDITVKTATVSRPGGNGGGGGGGTTPKTSDDAVITPDVDIPGAVNTFSDVKQGDWFYDDVMFAFSHNLLQGISAAEFSPNAPMTRGMTVTLLYRLADESAADAANTFSDVADGKYYAESIAWALSKGIAGGYGNGLFGPEDTITRQDLAVILLRYAEYKGLTLPAIREYSDFSDDKDVSDYSRTTVETLYKAGIISGKPGNRLDPKGTATRAEVAAMIRRFLEAVG